MLRGLRGVRWCRAVGPVQGLAEKQAKLMRKVVRECNRIDRGSARAMEDTASEATYEEMKEARRVAELKAKAARSPMTVVYYWYHSYGSMIFLTTMFIVLAYLYYYAFFLVPLYGDSMSLVPFICKRVFWDSTVSSRELSVEYFRDAVIFIKKHLFRSQYDY